MDFKSTKGMTPDTAPDGVVLVKYLKPSFGGWCIEYTIGYFDNPNDYEEPNDNVGWKSWDNSIRINVIAYCELPVINSKENPWVNITQITIKEEHGSYFPNYGCVNE